MQKGIKRYGKAPSKLLRFDKCARAGLASVEGEAEGREALLRLPESHWMQWRERCASQLCDASIRDALQGFVAMRFNRLMERTIGRFVTGAGTVYLPASECMHLLESFVAIGRGKKGKAYKEWLFDRASCGGIQAIEGGVTVLIRDVVREHARREYAPSFMTTVNERVQTSSGRSVTLEQLVSGGPGPDDQLAAVELQDIASGQAAMLIENLEHREVTAILAKEIGLSLADPVVLEVAGCRKSVLNDSHRKLCGRIADILAERFAREDLCVVRQLVALTLGELSNLVMDRARKTSAYNRLFTAVEKT
jgi:hypothetical protein